MENIFYKTLYSIFYQEDLEWLENDMKFYSKLQKPEVKKVYKKVLEEEITQLKKLKAKCKLYE
jgi:hypothetical protein